ncbi:porin [Pelagibacterium luteolum]|uniref:Porin n=1 Tax=Pelagibacterium luteolum TaxID=440168 RepID=A0A1G7WH57_9HYPH|nr:porin [Pelagibacterium luteolum]SDG71347.1 Outer membrane protein (porin) [Pelagibacterium luteolum]
MKLKSLLLGSAAVLALSTGAQAADPIAEFVSLGVCDAYGISGLTIESDDTCLSISGSVEYTFETGNYGAGFGSPTDFFTDSLVEWQLLFEATTQTDAGAATAVIRLNDGTENANGDINPEIERAYVSFGDTTVITAGRIGSIFDTVILDRSYGALNFDELDKGDLANSVATGGHGIQIESLIADGFSVLVGLENLQVDDGFAPNNENGTAGLAVAYDNGGISGEVGVLLGDIFDSADQVNYYARVMAEFDAFSVRGGVVADDTGDWIATIGAGATFDMFSLDVDAAFTEADEFAVAGEGSFGATDTIDVYLGAAYAEDAGIMNATYYDNGALVGETFAVYAGVNAEVVENISVNAEVGYVDYSAGDLVYGAGGVTYAPGGNFETGLSAYADTDDVYAVTFSASKSF